ncbi:TPA: iron chelate uptake ABC transporter family permease subunit [Pseudomonas aeruginosa]|nr:iron chelate uptake ABC transporter family permease subunit [Pseudomonas aeruginosa]MBI8839787.1 iron chelate uptake ABC transporter family permease subunit [Pseudomonas aeruginosa]HCF2111298.1 iron chelate uptake ABC transporter family permease subunit [Pseudomonas aeruginosa]HEJ4521023.1 iron chelate uptake ABC transporter family permease subunit [Pseudomonas aeruginosa]HEJ4533367.1 iron chelate uptake ABC transporter family permease subunit [Pseudomonas aeruginosa]
MQASPMRRRRLRAWGLLAGALLLALAALASLALGSRPVPLAVTLDALQAVDPHDDRHLVVRELRLPRTLVALLAGAATALAGPIAFVGLVAPHLARLLAGPDQRWILPFSALIAAGLLLGADILGRLLAAPAEIAAGIVALLLGGPAFIVLVRRFRLSRL